MHSRFGNEVHRTSTKYPGPHYGRFSPLYHYNIAHWPPGRRHTSSASCMSVLFCWNRLHRVSTPTLYKSTRIQVSYANTTRTLSTHNTTPSSIVTYFAQIFDTISTSCSLCMPDLIEVKKKKNTSWFWLSFRASTSNRFFCHNLWVQGEEPSVYKCI